MSKAPAMPMYWDAYLADTTHLTTEEHGVYMLLLAAMWRRNGYVPDDDKDNARILGLTPAKWRKAKARLLATISGFKVENGSITQEKLQKTWEITQEKITKNKVNGAKGGRAAASKINNLDQANATVSVKPKSSIPEPEPEPEPERKKEKRVAAPRISDDDLILILSNSVSPDVAASFVQHRKDLKKPMTENMANAVVKKLEGHHAPDMVLTNSIANGWQGIFPEKITNGGHNGQRNHNGQNQTYTRGDAQFDEARERALRIASRPAEPGFDSF